MWKTIDTVPKRGKGKFLGKETGPYVLLSDGGEVPVIAFWNGHSFDDGDYNSNMDGFTHWMPLPEPPQ